MRRWSFWLLSVLRFRLLNVVEEVTEESYVVPSGRYDDVYSMGTICEIK
jgi:hypothetical protein